MHKERAQSGTDGVAGAQSGHSVAPVAYLWTNATGRTRVVMLGERFADDGWRLVGPLYLHPPSYSRPRILSRPSSPGKTT